MAGAARTAGGHGLSWMHDGWPAGTEEPLFA